MTLTFEIGSALIVCALFIVLALFRQHPRGAAAIATSIVLLLVAWANVSAGWDPATGVKGLIRGFFYATRFDTVLVVKTFSTFGLLAASWWIAGMWCSGDTPPASRPLRGRSVRNPIPGRQGTSRTQQQPLRQYRKP